MSYTKHTKQENREIFYNLLNEGCQLVNDRCYEGGILRLNEALLYTTPDSPMGVKINTWITTAEKEIRTILLSEMMNFDK